MWSNIEAAWICNDFVVVKEDTAINHLLHCITIAFFLKFLSESNLLSLDLWNGRGENVSYKLVFSKICPFLFPSVLSQVQGGCPLKCSCPSSPPSCPAGISSVLDPCGCCRVCARQFNQDCSPTEPCDHIKGLRCHLGAQGEPDKGLCRGKRNCVVIANYVF